MSISFMNLSTNETNIPENYSDHDFFSNISDISLLYSFLFWLLLSFDIPAIVFSFIVLFYLLFDRTQRQALNNHTFILLLCLTLPVLLIDIPLYLNYYRLEYVWPENPVTCYVWWFIDLAFITASTCLMSFASIERHILIFHERWLLSRKNRLLLHYFPHVIILLYCLIFYSKALFFPSCENIFIYTVTLCSTPCYFFVIDVLNIYDVLVHGVLPPVVIAFFNVFLLFRVICGRHIRFRRPITWRKYRRLTIQVLTVSLLYVTFGLPSMVLAIIELCGHLSYIGNQILLCSYLLSHFIPILLPFVCLGSLPELRTKLKKICSCAGLLNKRTRVQPLNR